MFPELTPPAAGVDAAGEDVFSAGFGPEHAGLSATAANHGLATRLDHA
jgi:hypothetical protein